MKLTPDLARQKIPKSSEAECALPRGDKLINNILLCICHNFGISGSLLHYMRGFAFRIANVILKKGKSGRLFLLLLYFFEIIV